MTAQCFHFLISDNRGSPLLLWDSWFCYWFSCRSGNRSGLFGCSLACSSNQGTLGRGIIHSLSSTSFSPIISVDKMDRSYIRKKSHSFSITIIASPEDRLYSDIVGSL